MSFLKACILYLLKENACAYVRIPCKCKQCCVQQRSATKMARESIKYEIATSDELLTTHCCATYTHALNLMRPTHMAVACHACASIALQLSSRNMYLMYLCVDIHTSVCVCTYTYVIRYLELQVHMRLKLHLVLCEISAHPC